jgi:hypothetical protein
MNFLVIFSLFTFAQSLELSSDGASHLLQPGMSVTGIDGVIVDALYAELKEPIEVTIERIDNPEVLPPFSYSLPVPITSYYKISSSKRHFIHPGDLGIYIPYPEGAPKDGLGVGFLIPSDIENTDSEWLFLPATYSPITNEILFGLKQIDPKGVVVVIARDAFYIPK